MPTVDDIWDWAGTDVKVVECQVALQGVTKVVAEEGGVVPIQNVDSELTLPIVIERIEPNPIIVPKPTLISKTSSSIEVEQTFQCDVDYYGGVGNDQTGHVDTKLVKTPTTMTTT